MPRVWSLEPRGKANIPRVAELSTWLTHSSGSQTFVLCSIAIATGAHIRVGFEDSPFLPH